jgi:predicted benzoate:H+ symporter BenE
MTELLASAKGAWAIVLGIVASGFTQLMGVLPDDMGKLTSLSGLAVAIAMFTKIRAEARKTQRETELIELEIKKRESE